MIVVVVRHKVAAGRLDQAIERIRGTTERIRRQPGNLFRHVGFADGDGEIVSVTGWRSVAAKEAWEGERRDRPPAGEMADVYSGFEVAEVDCSRLDWSVDARLPDSEQGGMT